MKILMLTAILAASLAEAKTPKMCNETKELARVIASHLRGRRDFKIKIDASNSFVANSLANETFVEKNILKRLNFHSIGLISTSQEGISNGDFLRRVNREGILLYKSFTFADDQCRNQSSCSELLSQNNLHRGVSRVSNSHRIQYHSDPADYLIKIDKAAKEADPLVDWLLRQRMNSVSNVDLLEKAVELYGGDVVKALGIIGLVFEEERRQAHPRSKQSILGSRLKPLFCDIKDDPYGYNYHFWAYLNLGMQGAGVQEQLFNYLFQSVYQKDTGDYWANKLGLDIGKKIYASFYREMHKSPLGKSQASP